MDEYKGLAQANKALKEAGASYQNSLTAGTADLSRYATMEEQAAMAGVYTFDAGYAALFLQKKETIALSDYPPEMLTLLDTQHKRLDFIGDLHNLMMVSEFTRREVDGLRSLISPEQNTILEAGLRGFAQN